MKIDTKPSGRSATTISMKGAEVVEAMRKYASECFAVDIPAGEPELILPNRRLVHLNDDFTLTVTEEK